jgi:hypothetical protein
MLSFADLIGQSGMKGQRPCHKTDFKTGVFALGVIRRRQRQLRFFFARRRSGLIVDRHQRRVAVRVRVAFDPALDIIRVAPA